MAESNEFIREVDEAVRQDRWFRRDPRIRWIEATDDPIAALDLIEQGLASCA